MRRVIRWCTPFGLHRMLFPIVCCGGGLACAAQTQHTCPPCVEYAQGEHRAERDCAVQASGTGGEGSQPQPAPTPDATGAGAGTASSLSTSSEPGASSVPSAATPQAATQPSTGPTEAELNALATGPATKGPRGSRRCEFHESVNLYRRQCAITLNADGSLQVTAKGTELNPENGFQFSMHGGPYTFVGKGELQAFDICKGPFVAYAHSVIDAGKQTYELRFKAHCMIVIR